MKHARFVSLSNVRKECAINFRTPCNLQPVIIPAVLAIVIAVNLELNQVELNQAYRGISEEVAAARDSFSLFCVIRVINSLFCVISLFCVYA